MPVKFRCQHCKQLLGISRKKIGQVVDCPKCGRSVRVPNEDGEANPAPKPEFNLEDSALVRALDELAAIGQAPTQNSVLSSPGNDQPEQDFGDVEEEDLPLDSANRSSVKGSWLPAPQLFVNDPPLPAVKVDAPSPPATAHPPVAAPVVVAPVATASSAPPSSASNWREIASIAPAGSPYAPARGLSTAFNNRLALAIAAVAGMLAGMVIGFAGGYLLRPAAKPAEVVKSPEAPAPKPDVQSSGLKGKITYKSEAGEKRPDEGSRILVLPENRSGTLKLSAVGLRLGDPDGDAKVAQAIVRALGGDVGVAGADGQFVTHLPAAGNYHIVVLSAHQASDKDAPLTESLRAVLASYFEKPADFVGQRAVHHEQVRYKGEGTDPWDYSFSAP